MSFLNINIPSNFTHGYQQSIDYEHFKYCYKYEYDSSGKRILIATDDRKEFLDWVETIPSEDKCFYEMIRDADIVAEYYDIDFATEEISDSICYDIVQNLVSARNEIAKHIVSIKDFVVLESHRPGKLSLHVISKSTYFTNNSIQRVFATHVSRILQENAHIDIDTSVYSRNRCFRMVKNRKFGKDTVLTVSNPAVFSFATTEETLCVLTHTDVSKRKLVDTFTEEDVVLREHKYESTDLEDDIEELLNKFLADHPYLELGQGQRINRVDHETRQCLIDPKDYHSSENMFWYTRRYSVFVSCFCRKGKDILLGYRSGIREITKEPEEFSLGTHTSDDFKSYSDFGDFNTIFDKRVTGKGKTTSAMNYALSSYTKVLVVHHRLSLDEDYLSKYPQFQSYQNNINADFQTVCFNSLTKVDASRFDVIIFDEIRSVLKQTGMRDMMFNTHELFNILENKSYRLMFLDANMTDNDINLIQKHRNDPNPIVIHDENPNCRKKVFIHPDEDEIMYCIKRDLQDGKKVVIMYNRSIEYMKGLLTMLPKDKRIGHINRLTRNDFDMDTSTWYDNYDVIAYSPTISEGVSISDTRYKDVNAYGIFSGMSCPAETVSQMIARFRPIQTISISIDLSKSRPYPRYRDREDVIDRINNNIKCYKKNISNCNYQRVNSRLEIIQDAFFDLFCKNELELSKDYNNYYDTLIQKLSNNGYKLFHLSISSEVEEGALELIYNARKGASTTRRNEKTEEILFARDLSRAEYACIKEDGVQTEEQENQVIKYQIKESTHVSYEHLTDRVVDNFKKDGPRKTLKNVCDLFEFYLKDNGSIGRCKVHAIFKKKLKESIELTVSHCNFYEQKSTLLSSYYNRAFCLNSMIQMIGFTELASTDTLSINRFFTGVKRVETHYKSNYDRYRSLQMLFSLGYNRQDHIELTIHDILYRKLYTLFKIKISYDPRERVFYQRIDCKARFHNEGFPKEPAVFSRNQRLVVAVAPEYERMFEPAQKCEKCKKPLKTMKHVNKCYFTKASEASA